MLHGSFRHARRVYNARMTKRPFGKTGFEVSVLGFGAAPVAYLKSDQDKSAAIVEQLLAAGVNLIDTAASYPGSEEFLGKRFSKRRNEFVLVSKCGNKIPESDAPAWSAALITASVERSLRLLKTDHLDVMLLHSCDLATLKKGEALGALVKAREAGKLKFVGYSGDNEAAAHAATLPDVAVIETSINIADQVNIDSVLPLAKQNNIGVLAKRPIANAAWKDVSEQPGMYQSYAATYTDRIRRMKFTPESVGFDGSWAEMALRFTLSFDSVSCAIIGTTNPDNAVKNIEYASKGPLPDEIVTKIREAFRRADVNNDWKGQT